MSNKLFLSLGDIIQISAPTNLEIHDKIFLISYLDVNIIKLIDATSEGTAKLLELNINDGQLSEESIEEIAILNHPDQKGFARQQDLLQQNWIDIYFGGDVPAVLTGEINNKHNKIIITVFDIYLLICNSFVIHLFK